MPVNKRFNQGLTLVEMLVVFAIVLVLATLLTSAGSLAIAAAKGSASLSNLRQLGQGQMLYAADHDDYLPPYLTEMQLKVPLTDDPLSNKGAWAWKQATLPYVGADEVYYCPIVQKEFANWKDVPFHEVEWYLITGYRHIDVAEGKSNFTEDGLLHMPLSAFQDPANKIWMGELYKGLIRPIGKNGIGQVVPPDGKTWGFLYGDGHVKRIPWEPEVPRSKKGQ